jgi:hypothetical protein
MVLKLEGDLDLDSTDELQSVLLAVLDRQPVRRSSPRPTRISCPFGP